MKSNEQEQAEWKAFQERWKDASREEMLKRLYGAQHQATFYAHQIGAFPEAAKRLEDQLASARRLIDRIIQGEITEQYAQIFLQQVLSKQAIRGEPDHSAQGPAPEEPDGKTIEEEGLIHKGEQR